MTKLRILALIGAFVSLTLGSFIWYIATWDATTRAPTGQISQ
jgi:hypothetical protein